LLDTKNPNDIIPLIRRSFLMPLRFLVKQPCLHQVNWKGTLPMLAFHVGYKSEIMTQFIPL